MGGVELALSSFKNRLKFWLNVSRFTSILSRNLDLHGIPTLFTKYVKFIQFNEHGCRRLKTRCSCIQEKR